MDSGSHIPPIPLPTKSQPRNALSRSASSVFNLKPVALDLSALEVTRDDSRHLDVQYLELVSTFQSLMEKLRNSAYLDASLPKRPAFSLLQTALVDLRVWAYDLSSDDNSLPSSLRNILGGSSDLKAMVQQIMGNISQNLRSIEEEADKMRGSNSRS